MKTLEIVLLAFIILTFISSCKHHKDNTEVDYFGMTPPIDSAQIFAPGIISLEGRWEGNVNFSLDGKELYFNVFQDTMTSKSIYWAQYSDKKWSTPTELEALGGYDNYEPFISYSGKELFFISTRDPGEEEWNGRIWKTKKDASNNWTTAKIIDIASTKNGMWFPNHSQVNSEILYFGGNLESIGSVGQGDLYYFNMITDSIVNIQELNSEKEDWDPYISPDERYLIWASERDGGYGGTDIYVSFKVGKKWGSPINLGERVNGPGYEVAPRISSDGRILFFDRPSKGTQDIYWISSSIIENLKY